ncbi:MAG: glycosyltransferase, partial [Micavibrio sp.]|nr:glycosyltransferase [Micavibrio sp.]
MATTKKKKVLFVLPSLASGGAERVMINFMNAIDRNIYEPEFLCVCNEGELRSL